MSELIDQETLNLIQETIEDLKKEKEQDKQTIEDLKKEKEQDKQIIEDLEKEKAQDKQIIEDLNRKVNTLEKHQKCSEQRTE